MSEDAELLRRYAEDGSEPAFAELVQRHLNLVYFAALRQVGGDAHRARDVAQVVFTDLARKAATLSRHAMLTGWLYTSTHYAAAKAVRGEQRRQIHEQEAHAMNEILQSSAPEADWDRLRPVLDDVMLELKEADREAVLLRFFEARPFAEVGAKLRLSEDAARMRVERALDRLRALLAQRGVTSTTTALGLALANQVAAAVPAGLATAVTGAALAGATTGSAVAGFTFMSLTKLQLGFTGALALAGAGGFAYQQQSNAELRRELGAYRTENQQVAELRAENERLGQARAEADVLRRDDAELASLRAEASTLTSSLRETARAQFAAAAASKPEDDTALRAAAGEPSTLDQLPKVVFQARPVYPFEMKRSGTSGKVVVDFVVGSDGMVHNAIAVSSTQEEFEAAAVEAVSKWKFSPGQKNGAAVNVHLQVPIVFSTGSGSSPPKHD